ncbi:MAG: Tim44/TimA family putative adaptor protein [Micavibrio sp.]|nr:Tim44/TimA family putative adaptor protein [Micavibrio sp.]
MPAELFVYAIVAAGLVFWLRSILGTRHGEERSRPDPFVAKDTELKDAPSNVAEIRKKFAQEDEISELAENPTGVYAIAGKLVEDGLLDIARADKTFDIKLFLEGAQDAFVIIVESFADGDRETLRGLLGDDVYNAFDEAITAREEANQTQITDIHAIRKVEIVETKLEGGKAAITAKIIADETSVTKDEEGNTIAGHPDATTEMRDIWTFARDIKSRNPAWLVTETRGGFEDDNDIIPDTHKH